MLWRPGTAATSATSDVVRAQARQRPRSGESFRADAVPKAEEITLDTPAFHRGLWLASRRTS